MTENWGSVLLRELTERCRLTVDNFNFVTDVSRGVSVSLCALHDFAFRFQEQCVLRYARSGNDRSVSGFDCADEPSPRTGARWQSIGGGSGGVVEAPLVSITTNDGLLLSLAESSCLMGGIPFFPQNPRDPPARRKQLADHFGVVLTWETAQLQEILDAVLQGVEGTGVRAVASCCWSDVVDAEVPDAHVAYIITTSGSTGTPKGVVAERRNLRAYVEGFACTVIVANDSGVESGEDECCLFDGQNGLRIHHWDASVSNCRDRVLLLSSCTFDPSIGDIASCLHSGALLCCASRDAMEGGGLAAVVCAANPTHIISTPALWQTMPCAPTEAELVERGWSNVRHCRVFLGGEPLPDRIARDWASLVMLYNIYGVTEVTIYQAIQRVAAPPAGEATTDVTQTMLTCTDQSRGGRWSQWMASNCSGCRVPCGQAVAPNEFWIDSAESLMTMDKDSGEHKQQQQEQQQSIGEVILSGPQVCRGYFDYLQDAQKWKSGSQQRYPFFIAAPPLATSASSAAVAVGCYATGDIGYIALVPHPFRSSATVPTLVLKGRADFQVKLNGQRVALEECDRTIRDTAAPALAAVCCVAVPKLPTTTSSTTVNEKVLCAACTLTPLRTMQQTDVTGRTDDRGDDDLRRLVVRSQLWARALRLSLEHILPNHMIPQYWTVLMPPPGSVSAALLPTTTNGKTNRKNIEAFFMEHMKMRSARVTASSAVMCAATSLGSVEKAVVVSSSTSSTDDSISDCSDAEGCWRSSLSALGRLVVDEWEAHFLITMRRPDAHFLRLGGDSLGALKVVRSLYLKLHGGADAGIDRYGNMPGCFAPRHLTVEHPELGRYIAFLEDAMAGATAGEVTIPSIETSQKRHRSVSDAEAEYEALPLETDESDVDDGSDVAPSSAGPPSRSIGAQLLMDIVDMEGGSGVDMHLLSFVLRQPPCVGIPVDGFHDAKHARCTSPLHVAVANGATDVVRVLLDHGAKMTCVNADGVSPAHLAAMNPHGDGLLDLFAKRGFPMHCRDKRQQSLLHVAARFGSMRCVRYLMLSLESPLDPTLRDCWQRTAAHWAVLNNHLEVVAFMGSEEAAAVAASCKRQVRRGGKSTKERSARLAKRRTHLAYETAGEMAVRLYGASSAMASAAAGFRD